MTSTTERPVTPWPTRREREGGPARRPVTAARPVAPERPVAYVPRHAAADPDVTERLPIVVPAQRSAEVRPAPAPRPVAAAVPMPAPVVAPPVDAPAAEYVAAAAASTPAAAVPVPEPAAGPTGAPSAPHPAPGRPAATPRPPRPAVGGAVHGVRPGARPTRNGLGVAAACLGAIALPFGLLPVTGFVAAGLGVLALAFGIAGWVRVRSGTASNRGAAGTGTVLGLIALGLGVIGTVAFVRAPDRLVYDLNALTAPSTSAIVVTPPGE